MTLETMNNPDLQPAEQTEALSFAAGFDGDETRVIEADPAAGSADQPDAPADDTSANGAEAAQAVAAPEFVTITAEQWAGVQSAVADLKELKTGVRTELDKLGGKFGEVNRAMKQRPAGTGISKEALAHLTDEYPELGGHLKNLFIDTPAEGTAQANADATEVDRLVQERTKPVLDSMAKLQELTVDYGMRVHHKDWRKVINSPEFESWRTSLPAAEAHETLNSDDVDFAAGQIDKFKAHQVAANEAAAQAAKAAAATTATQANRTSRTQSGNRRLEAAITPQGTSKTGAPTKTEADYFRDGFKS